MHVEACCHVACICSTRKWLAEPSLCSIASVTYKTLCHEIHLLAGWHHAGHVPVISQHSLHFYALSMCRGLKTALIEREDFGSGTSSKSTKLVHGGVRYLEKAVFNLDYGQLKLVYEALFERRALLDNAPHLTHALPILMPCYQWWEVPFFWAGLKMYDLIAGVRSLSWSKYVPPQESTQKLPTLSQERKDGKTLKGTVGTVTCILLMAIAVGRNAEPACSCVLTCLL